MTLEKKLISTLKYSSTYKLERIFQEIYEKYYKFVYFIVKQYGISKEDIEEITNDVFIKFFNYLNRDTKIENIKLYLMQCAKNAAMDFLKKNKIQQVEYNDAIKYKEENKESNDIFDKAKSILTDQEYDLLIKHIIYGYSLRSIAKQNNASSNTVKSSYRRLIKKLRDELGGYHE